MIENIRDLVDVVPRLNIFADDELARLCEQVKDRIASVEPDALRPSKTFDPAARAQVKRDADALAEKFAGYFAPPPRAGAGGRVMSSRVLAESALRVSDCVTELLRQATVFREPRAEAPASPRLRRRETLATDGHEIRYSPRWVAETDSHLIETSMARVVMACALKHYTRRGERDPERWQMASQLVTHGAHSRRRLHPAAGRRGMGRPHRRASLRPPPCRGRGVPRRRRRSPPVPAPPARVPPRPGNPRPMPMTTTPAIQTDSADHADGEDDDGDGHELGRPG